MTEIERLLESYEVDVDFPEVSGMEHLQMLATRSELYRVEHHLTPDQKQRLADADQKLLRQASQFYQAIQSIADLAQWRQTEAVTPEQWWWYLDILAQLPAGSVVSVSQSMAA